MAKVTESFVEPVVTRNVAVRLDINLARELNVFDVDAAETTDAPLPKPAEHDEASKPRTSR